jgi:hypothetical protein
MLFGLLIGRLKAGGDRAARTGPARRLPARQFGDPATGHGPGRVAGGQWLTTDSAGHIAHYGINGWLAAGIAVFASLSVLRLRAPQPQVCVPAPV